MKSLIALMLLVATPAIAGSTSGSGGGALPPPKPWPASHCIILTTKSACEKYGVPTCKWCPTCQIKYQVLPGACVPV